jgi:pimeloyl-ACP methyl ester carboxylesterase
MPIRLPVRRAALPMRGSDLRGVARLGIDATLGVTGIVEGMHAAIARRVAPLGTATEARTTGLTGFVYGLVRGSTRLVGRGLDAALAPLDGHDARQPTWPRREAFLAALNGVWGDHLEASGNPLAITMALRVEGRALDLDAASLAAQLPQASGRIAVLAHGLCMNDLQWCRKGRDLGAMLARDAGFTPVYLHYNSGLHVPANGRRLDELLEALVRSWPVPVEEITLIGHSMGGLVARSACRLADQRGAAWRSHLRRLVCLGTPHHGAPLERGGHLVDLALGASPYAAPLARLGKARSAGIQDLRFGNVHEDDVQERDHRPQRRDDRHPVPFPHGVEVFLVAATRGDSAQGKRGPAVGDGLVPLASALGEHRQAALELTVPAARRMVVTRANHFDLLDLPEVQEGIRRWLA